MCHISFENQLIVSIFTVDANKTGAAQEAITGIRRASKAMTEQEARQILGISEQSTWEEIVQVCDNIFMMHKICPCSC
jgi:hypothetical protein